MCDVLSGGFPEYVTKCDRGRGSKLAKNSVKHLLSSSPLHEITWSAFLAAARLLSWGLGHLPLDISVPSGQINRHPAFDYLPAK